jgi:hypothetical protein
MLLALAVGILSVAAAEEPGPVMLAPPGAAAPQTLSLDAMQAKASVQWLASLALQKMPRTFDGDKNWGDTKRVWSGVKMRLDGLKLKTNRRFREVEQGRWVKYQVTLPDPAADNAASVTVHQVVPSMDPVTGDQRWKIDSSIVSPMKFTARVQRWNLGVKLYSVTITGEMRVRLASSASVAFFADYAEIPPALVIDPQIEQAQLVLERFEVDRVSHIGGDAAEQWGELMEEILVDRFVKKQNEKLVDKLNRSIEKERDDLRLSMADWFASW